VQSDLIKQQQQQQQQQTFVGPICSKCLDSNAGHATNYKRFNILLRPKISWEKV